MRAHLTVKGFDFTPEAAIADLKQRCAVHIEKGWKDIYTVGVERGTNPYSDYPVHGYVATTVLENGDA